MTRGTREGAGPDEGQRLARLLRGHRRGSASIKQVMRAITGCGYDELDIQEGATTSMEFMRLTFGDVTAADHQRVRRQLEVYCGRDTGGVVWILDELRRLAA